jgi:hypothetical protein
MGQPPQVPIPDQLVNLDIEQVFNANKPAGTKALLGAIAEKRKAEILSLVLIDFLPVNPMLAGDVLLNLEPVILGLGKVRKLVLFLRSTGGVAEIPWRIVSVLRSFCEEFEVVIPRGAMSGATHIALGADNIVMTPLSCLGSVDPSRAHALLTDRQGNPLMLSVQDLKHCLQFLKRNVPKREMGDLLGKLFTNVSPLVIGALEESYELSRLITSKVLGTRKNKLPASQVKDIVDRLAGKYCSHGYPVSRSEVQSELRLPVTEANPGDPLFDAIESLNGYYMGVFEKEVPVSTGPMPLSFKITGFIENALSRRIMCQIFAPNAQPVAAAWMKEANS